MSVRFAAVGFGATVRRDDVILGRIQPGDGGWYYTPSPAVCRPGLGEMPQEPLDARLLGAIAAKLAELNGDGAVRTGRQAYADRGHREPEPVAVYCYDGDKYCFVNVDRETREIKAGYLYEDEEMTRPLDTSSLPVFDF